MNPAGAPDWRDLRLQVAEAAWRAAQATLTGDEIGAALASEHGFVHSAEFCDCPIEVLLACGADVGTAPLAPVAWVLPIVLAETIRRRVGPERFGFAGGGRTIDLSGRVLEDAVAKMEGEPAAIRDAPGWLLDRIGESGLGWVYITSDPRTARTIQLALQPLGVAGNIWRLRISLPSHDTNFGWLLPSEIADVFAGLPQQGESARVNLARFGPLCA